ncbi:hypothetical protein FEM48_Zijuj12G0059300 [Ziziphus jujuba var. spinosa]|uniref:Solute carrier family 35 member F1-like n=1 Tax=Ziziphus jujuba var. spinosa TaxID=714518 RepID=A0A978UBK1_ZIZJJ|nr:hypothetical protein FEM48_Zijuj12G0059300 [Ziziphus jujuba var. spinosa]
MDWSIVNSWRSNHGSLRTLYVLFLGQLVSFSLALCSFFSSLIAKLGVDAPLSQSLFVFITLALVYGSILLSRRQQLQVSWYWYLLLAFVEVQGSYLFNKSLQYSSITNVTLLDCWTIAWAIILTWIFLGTRYSLWQIFGAAVSVLGLGLVLLSDAGVGGGGSSRPLLGDILVIAATLCYAISNVGEEFCVKRKDQIEVVSMIGVYGTLVSLFEISIVELKKLESVKWSAEILSGSTMFNLSLLTSDMWAVVFRIFFYHQQVDWLYYIAFVVVVIGLIIYSTSGKDPIPASAIEDGIPNIQYKLLNKNAASINESLT